MKELLNVLPKGIVDAMQRVPKMENITEIRLRNLRPVIVYVSSSEYVLN